MTIEYDIKILLLTSQWFNCNNILYFYGVFQSNFMIPLQMKTDVSAIDSTFSAIGQYLTPTLLSKIRLYLTTIREIEFSIPPEVEKVSCWLIH